MRDVGSFFSSRRRHTSWNCDWSSDVCSSDLCTLLKVSERGTDTLTLKDEKLNPHWAPRIKRDLEQRRLPAPRALDVARARSEERRVGKECRARREQHHQSRTERAPGTTTHAL